MEKGLNQSKIGVIAGVFDPIHNGHLDFIERTIDQHKLDKVLVLLERNSAHKPVKTDYRDREKMTELAISKSKKVKIFKHIFNNYPLTNCLPKIKKQNPKSKLYILIGSDVAHHIETWDNYQTIFDGVELVVAERGSNEPASKIRSGLIRETISKGHKPDDIPDEVYQYIKSNDLYI